MRVSHEEHTKCYLGIITLATITQPDTSDHLFRLGTETMCKESIVKGQDLSPILRWVFASSPQVGIGRGNVNLNLIRDLRQERFKADKSRSSPSLGLLITG